MKSVNIKKNSNNFFKLSVALFTVVFFMSFYIAPADEIQTRGPEKDALPELHSLRGPVSAEIAEVNYVFHYCLTFPSETVPGSFQPGQKIA